MYLIFKLFYLYTPLNLLCKEMRCLNNIIIIIIINSPSRAEELKGDATSRSLGNRGKVQSVVYLACQPFMACQFVFLWSRQASSTNQGLIIIIIIYSASVAGEETLHTYSYVQSHIKDTR